MHVHVIQIPLEVIDINLKFHDREFLLKKAKKKKTLPTRTIRTVRLILLLRIAPTTKLFVLSF